MISADQNNSKHWVIDKRIPLALIFTILVHFAGFVYAYAKLSIGQNNHEVRITKIEERQDETQRLGLMMAERMSRVEALLQAQLETSKRIENKLDRQNHE